MLGRTLPAAEWSITWHPIYCHHISISNQVGLQLASWRDRGSHVTDQLKEKVAHSLRWFTAQQFVPTSVWIRAVYLLYTNLSRLEICICQMSPITPAACHTWGSSQPGGGKGREKRRSVAVSTEASVDWKGTRSPISRALISSNCRYFCRSPTEWWVNDRACQASH